MTQGDLVSLMQSESARVRVTNNTYTGALDIRTGNFLRAEGVQVLEIGIPTGASNQTMLIVYSPKLYTLKYLANVFGLTSYQILMNSTRPQVWILKSGSARIGLENYQMGISEYYRQVLSSLVLTR
jgi:hypothetical protein